MAQHDWLSPREAADRLDICVQTLYRWLEQGHITARRTPTGRWRIDPASLDAVISEVAS